jgi:hypothetical protein
MYVIYVSEREKSLMIFQPANFVAFRFHDHRAVLPVVNVTKPFIFVANTTADKLECLFTVSLFSMV